MVWQQLLKINPFNQSWRFALCPQSSYRPETKCSIKIHIIYGNRELFGNTKLLLAHLPIEGSLLQQIQKR